MSGPVRVAVVPHTHWDREWYATFESFRARLVDLLDDLIPLLEGDPGYAHFQLDGQLAVVDDYLAIRPEHTDRLRRLIGSGRISVGPWYTLPDEWCVSGETLIRDLQLGMERAAAFGGSMPVGYLPDMFGHVAQMPQILRLAGFDRAVVWRGVPSAIDRTSFWWSAPDGSTLLTEYLWHGYGVGARIPDDAKALVARLRKVARSIGDARHGDLLFMNGTDHERPQPWLSRVVAEANDLADDLDIRVTSLASALATTSPDIDLPHWTGELRSGARANLLMGVISNRVDIKQAAAAAERQLERIAEPLCALYMPEWPSALLADAWLQVVRNAAHDSSCACSIDDVCNAVTARYRSAFHTAEALSQRARRALAATLDEPGFVVFNPTARARGGILRVDLVGEGPAGDAQILAAHPALLEDRWLDEDEARSWLAGWRSQDMGQDRFLADVTVTELDSGDVELILTLTRYLGDNMVVPAIAASVAERLEPGSRLHLRVEQEPWRRLLCYAPPIPGFGWTRWVTEPMSVPPVSASANGLSNGLVTLIVSPDDGTFTLDGEPGLGLLSESGDYGDTYNYGPPDEDVIVSVPHSLSVDVVERGPVRGRIEIRATYYWPTHVADGRRVGSVATEVVTRLELRAGERWVRVRHAWNNQARDHRVRAVFPVDPALTTTSAECAFAVVTRDNDPEGGPSELPLATYPSRRFVQAGDVTVVHDGLLEYELTPAGLALTLVRSTGMLSRVDLPMRPMPAGPPIELEGAQVQGPFTVEYAVCVDPTVDPYAMADEVLVPLLTARGPGGGPSSAHHGHELSVEGAEVSAVLRRDDHLEVRVFNPTDTQATVTVAGRRGWIVNLRGRPIAPWETTVGLGPWEIATLRLT